MTAEPLLETMVGALRSPSATMSWRRSLTDVSAPAAGRRAAPTEWCRHSAVDFVKGLPIRQQPT